MKWWAKIKRTGRRVVNRTQRFYSYWQAGKSRNKAFRDKGNPGPNLANLANLGTIRMRARDAIRNAPLAARAIEVDITNMIGTGIVPRFEDRLLTDLWLQWEDECDAAGLYDIYGMQEAAVRAWREAGEAFVRMRWRRLADDLAVPLQLELLEADMLPLIDYPQLANGNRIIQGVEFNRVGRRVAYWFHREHPNESYSTSVNLADLTRVPARDVVHLYEALRPGQVRGVPPMVVGLQRMQQMNDFDESTLERQKQASHFTAFFMRPEPEDPGTDPVTGDPIEGREMADIEPGSGYTLLPGEDVKFPDLPSLGGDYEPFQKISARVLAAGLSMPYELLTGDFSNLSDRTARVLINEYRRRVEQHQWNRIVRQMMRPIKLRFIEAGLLANTIPENTNDAVRWVPPAWPYFHPVQDVQAHVLEVKAGFRSQSDVIHSRGHDPDQVRAERAEEQEADRKAGLTSSTTLVNPDTNTRTAGTLSDRRQATS
ncbi:MAG: phage portal protein [Saccharospirillum sp.]|nr:phage portal protein [Saccharospirillum sp.]